MYRAILPEGDIACADFRKVDEGVEILTDDGTMIAFIPYHNLVAIVNRDVEREDERSIM